MFGYPGLRDCLVSHCGYLLHWLGMRPPELPGCSQRRSVSVVAKQENQLWHPHCPHRVGVAAQGCIHWPPFPMGKEWSYKDAFPPCAVWEESKPWFSACKGGNCTGLLGMEEDSPVVCFSTSMVLVRTWYTIAGIEYSILPFRSNSGTQASASQVLCGTKWTVSTEH